MKAFSQIFNLTKLKTLNKHALTRPLSYCNYSIYQYLYLYISMQLGLCNDENLFSIYVKGEDYTHTKAGTIQSVSVQYRYRHQPIRMDTTIML